MSMTMVENLRGETVLYSQLQPREVLKLIKPADIVGADYVRQFRCVNFRLMVLLSFQSKSSGSSIVSI